MNEPPILGMDAALCNHRELDVATDVITGEVKGERRWVLAVRARCSSCKRPFEPDPGIAPSVEQRPDARVVNLAFRPGEVRLLLAEPKAPQ